MGYVQCLEKGDQLWCLEAGVPHDDLKLLVVIQQGGRCSRLSLERSRPAERSVLAGALPIAVTPTAESDSGAGMPPSCAAPTTESIVFKAIRRGVAIHPLLTF
jgi:hypothetical protein